MYDSLISNDVKVRKNSQRILDIIVEEACPYLGIKYVELPLLGKNGLSDYNNRKKYKKFLSSYLINNYNNPTDILIETDIKPDEIISFYNEIDSNKLYFNYDSGNSGMLEFDPKDEIPVYGHLIAGVHIKDITLSEYSVHLGEGTVNFELIFKLLNEVDYKGDFILQAARGKNDIEIAKNYYLFTKNLINKYF